MSAAFEVASLQALTLAIEAQVDATRKLVEATQVEHTHLLAFEIEALSGATASRQTLVEHVGALNAETRRAFERAQAEFGEAKNVRELAARTGDEDLAERANMLLALTQALSELNAMMMVHAKRSVGTSQAYAALLTRGPAVAAASAGYNRAGRATLTGAAPGRVVLRSL